MDRKFISPLAFRWLPLVAVLAVALTSGVIWQALVARERDHVAQLAAAEATSIQDDLTRVMENQVHVLSRMARRLEFWGATMEPGRANLIQDEWARDAELYLQHQEGYQSIAWIDPVLSVRAVVPRQTSPVLLGSAFAQQAPVHETIEASRQTRQAKISRPMHLPSGGTGFVVCVPLFANGQFSSCLVGICDLRQLLDSMLRDSLARGYRVTVADASHQPPREVYQGGGAADPKSTVTGEARVDFDGVPWTIRVAPTQHLLALESTTLPEVTLGAGLLVACLLGAALYEFQRSGAWAGQIQNAHDRLKRAEQRHRLTLENCLDAFVTIDQNGLVREWNQQAERLFGWQRGEVVCRPLRDVIIPPEGGEAFQRGLKQFLQTGQGPFLNRRIELEAVRKDGRRFPVEATLTPIETDEGWLFTAFLRDIAEQKRMERRFHASVESAPTAMVMINEIGEIVLVNTETERLFGYSREELLGQSVEILVPERFRGQHPGMRAGFFKEPKARRMGAGRDLFGLRKDGTEFPVEIGLNPVETDEGLLVLSAIVDITERKRAEAELLTLNETLEQRVGQRTDELRATLKDLTIAKDAAEDASRAKSAFLANMSHEIRTPLNAIIGMTELVLDSSLNAQQREYLNVIRESGESLLTVINDVLDFSKIEAGRLSLEDEPFNHAELLGDTMKSLGVRAAAKGLELLCRIAPDVPALLSGDAGRLRQVLNNLVGNAVKFTSEGEVVVDVEQETSSDSTVVLHYAVRDTGIGIPEGKLERMFEAFEQADLSTTRRFGGTGLGLAISSRLVDMMGGRIWAESQEGHGSTFHFTTRFNVPREQPLLMTITDMEAVRGLRVLVVDDSATNRTLLHEMLTSWGMQPIEAEDAEKAVELMRRSAREGSPIPLLITDAHMPGVDGFELARRIKRDPELSGTIIMMLSSGDRPGELAAAEEVNIAAHLIKPIKQSELLDAILMVVGAVVVESGEPPAEMASRLASTTWNILLAEDSLVNQKLAVALLGKYGHRVEIANNGREAVELWKRSQYDLVLMDIQMPEMDGLEATKTIRAHERQRGTHTPIVAMTAHALKGDRERCLEAGMDDYVAKPIRRKELLDAISRILGPSLPPVGAASAQQGQLEAESHEEDDDSTEPVDAVVDWNVAIESTFGDAQLLRELAAACVRETGDLIARMHAAIRRSDATALARAAHTLKGQMRIFGAAVTEHLAFHIENTARDGKLDVAEPLANLEERVERIQNELLDFLAGRISLDQASGVRAEGEKS